MGSSESNQSINRIWTRFATHRATRWINGYTNSSWHDGKTSEHTAAILQN